jgi:hypothetical protein
MGFVYILAGFVTLIFVWSIVDQIRLSRHRGVSREFFIREFTAVGVVPEISAAVYNHYVSLCLKMFQRRSGPYIPRVILPVTRGC